MAFAPARVDAVMLEARATQLFGRLPSGDATPPADAFIELDVVSGSPTPATVRAACARARAAGFGGPAAVVVAPRFASLAAQALAASPVRVVVALGPHDDAAGAAAAGAHEIEIRLDAGALLAGRPDDARGQIAATKRACGDAVVKVVIGARELGSWTAVRRAAGVALAAGADFLKTAGDSERSALPALALLLSELLREDARRTGRAAGLAGRNVSAGARTGFVSIASETLGARWLRPELFRLAAGTESG
jgi:deoxyribose-phosphate aldolase